MAKHNIYGIGAVLIEKNSWQNISKVKSFIADGMPR